MKVDETYIGSEFIVSCKLSELIPAFSAFLKENCADEYAALLKKHESNLKKLGMEDFAEINNPDFIVEHSKVLQEIYPDILDIMQDTAPEGCKFSHKNGSYDLPYGWWVKESIR